MCTDSKSKGEKTDHPEKDGEEDLKCQLRKVRERDMKGFFFQHLINCSFTSVCLTSRGTQKTSGLHALPILHNKIMAITVGGESHWSVDAQVHEVDK